MHDAGRPSAPTLQKGMLQRHLWNGSKILSSIGILSTRSSLYCPSNSSFFFSSLYSPIRSLSSAATTPLTHSSIMSSNTFDLDRPISDKRQYRHIVLPNKLEVILISDPECDRAACALNVGVGSLCDPKELPGLAHFLEHMLFLGTEKYPNENEYNVYLQQHGGESNAFTTDANTCYHFSIIPEHLDGAVDRFVQFFLGPLFTQSATDRELEAVHSEHTKNILCDSRRTYQLTKHLSNPNHPLSHFSTGNYKTLRDTPKEQGIDVRSELMAFHEKYYSSNIMRLCVMGRESLDDLEIMMRKDRFDLVKNNDVHVPEGEELGGAEVPFRKEDLSKIVRVVPVRDTRQISFDWLLPEQTKRWETKPTRYLSHVLGHEGVGSLLSALKSESLATELTSGLNINSSGISLFQIKVHLTESALTGDGIDRVGQLVFSYVKLLLTSPIQNWAVDELEQLAAVQFRFLSLSPPQTHVVNVAYSMHHFPPLRVLSGPFLSWKRDLNEVKEMMECLTSDRLIVQLSAKSFGADAAANPDAWKEEPYYQTLYKIEPLDDTKWSKAEDEAAHFLKPNPFVPKDLELKKRAEDMPKFPSLVSGFESANMKSRIYFKQDATFDLPKASLMLRFSSDLPRSGLRGLSLAELYLLTVQQLINEFAYDAEVAGLHYAICANIDSGYSGELGGFELQMSGYNDRMPVLTEALCQAIRRPELKQEAFEVAKIILCRELKIMANNQQPYQQAMQLRNKFLKTPSYLPHERLAVVETITFDDISSMVNAESNSLLQGLSVDALIQGNILEDEARALLSIVDKAFFENSKIKREASELEPSKVVDLRSDQPVRIRCHQMTANPEEANNASVLSILVGAFNIADSAFLNLAEVYLHQPFFDTLRTQQQLGYIVGCAKSRILHLNSLSLIVQSEKLKPSGVTERIAAFLEEYLTKPEEHLTEEEYEKFKQSTISHLEEKPKHIADEAHRNYNEVVARRFEFNRREQQAEFLRTASREQFLQFIKTSLYNSPWFNVEVESYKEPDTFSVEGPEKQTVPLKPCNPIKWDDVGEDAEKFSTTRAKAFFNFPLPGETHKY